MQFFERARNRLRDTGIRPVLTSSVMTIRGASVGFAGGGFFGAFSGVTGGAIWNSSQLLKGNNLDKLWLATRMNAAGDSLLGFFLGTMLGAYIGLQQTGYIQEVNVNSNAYLLLPIAIPLIGSLIGNAFLNHESENLVRLEESALYAFVGGLVFVIAASGCNKFYKFFSNGYCCSRDAQAPADDDNDVAIGRLV